MNDQSAPMPNSPEARTETGELKAPISTTTETTKETEPSTDTITETKVEPKKEEAKAGAPEKYEITAPADWKDKGYELDKDLIEKATPLFKELDLDNASAQKLVDFYAAKSATDHEAATKAANDLIKTQSETWMKELKADPEIGGKLDAVKARVGAMYSALPAPIVDAFKEQMEVTGIGNHPAFVRLINAVAERFTEGKHVAGKGPVEVKSPNGQAPSIASAIYPNLG